MVEFTVKLAQDLFHEFSACGSFSRMPFLPAWQSIRGLGVGLPITHCALEQKLWRSDMKLWRGKWIITCTRRQYFLVGVFKTRYRVQKFGYTVFRIMKIVIQFRSEKTVIQIVHVPAMQSSFICISFRCSILHLTKRLLFVNELSTFWLFRIVWYFNWPSRHNVMF